jgi:hypothetical protein
VKTRWFHCHPHEPALRPARHLFNHAFERRPPCRSGCCTHRPCSPITPLFLCDRAAHLAPHETRPHHWPAPLSSRRTPLLRRVHGPCGRLFAPLARGRPSPAARPGWPSDVPPTRRASARNRGWARLDAAAVRTTRGAPAATTMACSSLSAFAFFALPGGSMDAAIAAAAGAAAPPPPPSMGPYPSLARAGSAASGSAAAPAGDGDAGESDGCACRVCARPLSGRCGFCDAPGERPAFLCDACCWVCDGCGRAACGGCQGRFSECQQCGYLACDECCTQPGACALGPPGGGRMLSCTAPLAAGGAPGALAACDLVPGSLRSLGMPHSPCCPPPPLRAADADADGTKLAGAPGCWCDSTRKRDVGNRRCAGRCPPATPDALPTWPCTSGRTAATPCIACEIACCDVACRRHLYALFGGYRRCPIRFTRAARPPPLPPSRPPLPGT